LTPRPAGLAAWLLAGLLAALLVLRPAAAGVRAADAAWFWAFALAVAAVPGVVLYRALDPGQRDWALLLGQGTTLGLAIHGLASVAGLAAGRPWLGELATPLLAAAALGWRLRARPAAPDAAGGPGPPAPSGPWAWPLLAVVCAAVLIQPLFSTRDPDQSLPFDLLFHAGNASEMRQRWPLQDPRAAGLALNYPVVSYALPAAAARSLSLPTADALLGLAPLLWIALFVLQVHNAGHVLFADRRVGLVGAALASFHPDPGWFLGLPAGAFNSHYPTGLYSSPTTMVGFLWLLGMAVLLGPLLSSDARPARWRWAALALMGAAAAMTKASVLPPVLGGLALAFLWARWRGLPGAGRAVAAALVLAAVALPATRVLSSGEQSYRGLLRWGPGAVIWESAFARMARELVLGEGPAALWAEVPVRAGVAALWAVGYFGLVGVAAAAGLLLPRPALDAGRAWALGVLLAGAALTLGLQAYGLSQLFFVYNGQVLLALFAGAGLLAAWRGRPGTRLLLAGLALAALPAADYARRALLGSARLDGIGFGRVPPAEVRDYAQGLAWLRAHAGASVVFADNPSMLLSAFGECRVFYENGSFTPRGHEQRLLGNPEPYPERIDLQERLLRRPDAAVADEVRRLLPPGTVVRAVADAVQPHLAGGRLEAAIAAVPRRPLFPAELFELEYAGDTLHVYRLRSAAPAPAGP
jgi:hypothetical protein